MKHLSKLLALCLVLVCVLTACGTSEPAPETNSAPAQTEATPTQTEAVPVETEATGAVDWEDTAELEMYYFTFTAPGEWQHVEDAINEITEAEINTHVNITIMDLTSYMSQIGVMMAGGERIDLMLTSFGPVTYSAMVAQKQLMDIAPYLDTYGKDIPATLGDLLDATTVGDAVYAVPTYRSLVSTYSIYMRKDVLDSLGILDKALAVTSLDEYEEILAAVAASEEWNYLKPMIFNSGANLSPFGLNTTNDFANADIYDQLGDNLGIIHCDENGKVSLAWETESFKEASAYARKWSELGYFFHDISASQPSASDYVKADYAFSFLTTGEFGAVATQSATCQTEMVAIDIGTAPISAANCTKFTWAVPSTAEEPEAAVAFLNLAMTNADINILLSWGVEGVDFEVVDGVARYIDGNTNPKYHIFDYIVPNQFLVTPWDGDTADMRDRALAEMNEATISPYLGFSCDTSVFSDELSAVTNVVDEYETQIKSGAASEEVYQECIDKLYSVGVQAIIEGYQSQLDAWIAANK